MGERLQMYAITVYGSSGHTDSFGADYRIMFELKDSKIVACGIIDEKIIKLSFQQYIKAIHTIFAQYVR